MEKTNMKNTIQIRNMDNRKPYRTVAQKELARKMAVKCADGTWRSTAPVSYHKKGKKEE